MSKQIHPNVSRFLQSLTELDAGERARLKRDAGKAINEARCIGLFYRILPHGVYPSQEERYFLFATLCPMAEGGSNGNLGHALRRIRTEQNKKGLDRRVEILLDADDAQLAYRLRQAIRLLKANRVRVNWPQLMEDLLAWSHPRRFVQQRWARAYFGLPSVDDAYEVEQPAVKTESST